jgi:hypothetical protein
MDIRKPPDPGGFFVTGFTSLTRGGSMSTVEEVERAEAKMTAAKEALLSYIEGRTPLDRNDHRRLAARLKKTEEDFMKAIAELDT